MAGGRTEQYQLKRPNNRSLYIDLTLFDKNNNIVGFIELNGPHHYEEVTYGGNYSEKDAKKRLKRQQENDQYKKDYAAEKGIPILSVHYSDFKPLSRLEEKLREFVIKIIV